MVNVQKHTCSQEPGLMFSLIGSVLCSLPSSVQHKIIFILFFNESFILVQLLKNLPLSVSQKSKERAQIWF